jgi:xanthine/CO dehydrogenase XdhC/CoxF family maturation factor
VSAGIVGGQRAVIETAGAMRAAGGAFSLVLVAQTEGSTYRKSGAVALVGADGVHVGVISGGCLEVTGCSRLHFASGVVRSAHAQRPDAHS